MEAVAAPVHYRLDPVTHSGIDTHSMRTLLPSIVLPMGGMVSVCDSWSRRFCVTDDEGNPPAWRSVRLKHPHAADERVKSVGTDCVGGAGGGGDWWILTHMFKLSVVPVPLHGKPIQFLFCFSADQKFTKQILFR